MHSTRREAFFFPDENDILRVGDEVHFIAMTQDIRPTMIAFGYQENEGRQILIIGAGSIGRTLASEVAVNQPDVMVKMIEKNQECSEVAARLFEKC